MKKLIFTSILMLVAVLLLGSCGNRKDGALTVFYCITLSHDMDQMADMAVTYKLADGSTATDTITGTTWEKTVVLDTFPAAFGLVDYTFIPKAANSLKKEEYEPSVIFSIFARETQFQLETSLVEVSRVSRKNVASLIELANDHGDTGIIKIANKQEDNSFCINDSDPDTEKVKIISDNAIKEAISK